MSQLTAHDSVGGHRPQTDGCGASANFAPHGRSAALSAQVFAQARTVTEEPPMDLCSCTWHGMKALTSLTCEMTPT